MGNTKRFRGAAMNVKALLADAPKVRANAWEQGAGAAALAPVSKCGGATSSTQIVQVGLFQREVQPPTEPLRPQPAVVRPPLEEFVARPQEMVGPNRSGPRAGANVELGEGRLARNSQTHWERRRLYRANNEASEGRAIEMESADSERSGPQSDAAFSEEGSFGGLDVSMMLADGDAQPDESRHRRRRPRPKKPSFAAVIAHAENRQFEVPLISGEANPIEDQVHPAGGGDISSDLQRNFVRAVNDGNEEVVSRLAGAGARLNAKDQAGDTPLIKASEYGYAGLARVLLDAGAGINKRGRALQTALMRAVVSEHGDVVKFLIEAGANANIADSDDKLPIVRAVEQNNASLVEILHARSEEDPRLLPLAVQVVLDAGHAPEVPALLLGKGCSTEGLSCPETWGSDRTAFMRAVRLGNEALVRCLATAAAPMSTPASNGETPLVLAVKSASPDMVRTLLDCKCAADGVLRTTPLAHAAKADRPEIVEILLDAGCPIGEAAQVATGECLQLLQSAAERRVLVLTLYFEPSASEGILDVVCTDMGGSELALVRADAGAPLTDLRLAIQADLGDCEFPPQLLLSDGRLLETKDDKGLLGDVLGAAAEAQASIDATDF